MITSIENSKIKLLKKLLLDSKFRRTEFVISGKRWVHDALKKDAKIKKIFFSGEKLENLREVFLLAKEKLGEENILLVEDKVLAKVDAVENSQGVLAIVKSIVQCTSYNAQLKDRVLYLDGIKDPGNLGAIIRTAVAFGFVDIFLDGCVDVYNPKAVRSTMSTLLDANIYLVENTLDTIKALKANGCKVFSAVASKENEESAVKDRERLATKEFEADSKICLVIGSEATGISDNIIKNSDRLVSIKTQRSVESLNAAVAAGILMYYLSA